jgi:hypothetical protein
MPPLSAASDRLLTDLNDLSVKGTNLFGQINAKIVKLKAEGKNEFNESFRLHSLTFSNFSTGLQSLFLEFLH